MISGSYCHLAQTTLPVEDQPLVNIFVGVCLALFGMGIAWAAGLFQKRSVAGKVRVQTAGQASLLGFTTGAMLVAMYITPAITLALLMPAKAVPIKPEAANGLVESGASEIATTKTFFEVPVVRKVELEGDSPDNSITTQPAGSGAVENGSAPGGVRVKLSNWQIAILSLVTYVVGISVFFLMRPGGYSASFDLGLTAKNLPKALRVVLLGALAGFPLTYAAAFISEAVFQLLNTPHPVAHDMLERMSSSQSPVVLMLIILNSVLLAPIFEELLFRGAMQSSLTWLFPSRWMAIVIASLVFASSHVWWSVPAIFVLSVVIGYVYERTGNLWAAIGIHVLFNGISTTLFLLTR